MHDGRLPGQQGVCITTRLDVGSYATCSAVMHWTRKKWKMPARWATTSGMSRSTFTNLELVTENALTASELICCPAAHKTRLTCGRWPEPIYTAQVNSGTVTNARSRAPTTTPPHPVRRQEGMTLAAVPRQAGGTKGSSALRRPRSAFTVAGELRHRLGGNDYLASPEFRLWSVFPQVSSTGVFYKDMR